MTDEAGEITALLKLWQTGDADAEARLFDLVSPDLRRLARYFMRRDRTGHTLQPSALLNEAYLRLLKARDQNWQNRRHFFSVAAMAMRRCLVDYARSRPNARFEPINTLVDKIPARTSALETAIAIDRVLDELRRIDPGKAAIVEFKFFLGLTDQEASEALGLTLRSLQRSWQEAREWLYRRLHD
jgi:RNA polymerase sigma factor (TIGR02999 family)